MRWSGKIAAPCRAGTGPIVSAPVNEGLGPMRIYEFGKGHPQCLLLIHPSLVTWDFFERVIPLLDDRYHLLIPALPGYDLEDASEFESVERCARLLADELSAKQKLVFTLCQLEGLSSDEAEQITGLSARQVKSNLYAARQTIRERLKKLGYE